MNKNQIAEQIKKFMYDPTLTDIKKNLYVVSQSYLKSVIYSSYSQNSNDNPYSVIVGDFNKLYDLNSRHGMQIADRCMKRVLNHIKECLPPNTIICRNGGDEFLFILQGKVSKEQLQNYIQQINAKLSEKSEQLYGLTICLDCGTSDEAASLKELQTEVDKKVTDKKTKLAEGKKTPYNAYETLIRSLRLESGFDFSLQQKKRIIEIGIKALKEMLKTYNRAGRNFIYETGSFEFSERDTLLEPQVASEMNSIFLQPEIPRDNMLNGLSKNQLMAVAQKLVYREDSNSFSKDYFNLFLRDALNPQKKYKLHFFSLAGLKLANFIYGHSFIDKCLEFEFYSGITKKMSLKKSLFSGKSDCIKINMGGGDILIIEPHSHIGISDFINRKNSRPYYDRTSTEDFTLLSNILKYIEVTSEEPKRVDEILDFVNKSKEKAQKEKNAFLESILSSENDNILIRIACQILSADFKAYCEAHPDDYMDLSNLQAFLGAELENVFSPNSEQTASSPIHVIPPHIEELRDCAINRILETAR